MLAHRPLRLATVLALALALPACSDGVRAKPTSKATPVSVPSVPSTVNPAPTTPPAPSESATGAPSASGSVAPTGAAGGDTVKATATNVFEPATLTVKAGTKVTWEADPGTFHSANSGEPSTVDKSGPIQADVGFKTYSVTFKKPGTYKYFCQPHATANPPMVGQIVVT